MCAAKSPDQNQHEDDATEAKGDTEARDAPRIEDAARIEDAIEDDRRGPSRLENVGDAYSQHGYALEHEDGDMDMILAKRVVEAVLFAAEEPLDLHTIQAHLPGEVHARDVIDQLTEDYAERGVRLERHGSRYALRTAADIAPYLQRETVQSRRLSRAAIETLAIIAYHQPITRAEIEEVRGVSTNKGTLDLLIETGWVQPKGRRETPGRPVTWVTTPDFLDHLDLGNLDDLPRIEELLQVGLLGSPGALRGEPAAAGGADEEGAGEEGGDELGGDEDGGEDQSVSADMDDALNDEEDAASGDNREQA